MKCRDSIENYHMNDAIEGIIWLEGHSAEKCVFSQWSSYIQTWLEDCALELTESWGLCGCQQSHWESAGEAGSPFKQGPASLSRKEQNSYILDIHKNTLPKMSDLKAAMT